MEKDKTDWEMTIRQWLKWIFTGSTKAVKRKWNESKLVVLKK